MPVCSSIVGENQLTIRRGLKFFSRLRIIEGA
jgi:hypothetical protein